MYVTVDPVMVPMERLPVYLLILGDCVKQENGFI